MITELAQLKVPQYGEIQRPGNIPTGGILKLSGGAGGIIQIVFILGIGVCAVLLVWGGVMWIMSQGDKTKIAAARSRIIYALFGLGLMFASFMIVSLIGLFLNLKLI